MVPKYVAGTPFVSIKSMKYANVCKITIIMYQIQMHTQDVVSIRLYPKLKVRFFLR